MSTTPARESVRAWGRLMGSHESYIRAQVAQAEGDKAPNGALYERDGAWHTCDDVTRLDTMLELKKLGVDMRVAEANIEQRQRDARRATNILGEALAHFGLDAGEIDPDGHVTFTVRGEAGDVQTYRVKPVRA